MIRMPWGERRQGERLRKTDSRVHDWRDQKTRENDENEKSMHCCFFLVVVTLTLLRSLFSLAFLMKETHLLFSLFRQSKVDVREEEERERTEKEKSFSCTRISLGKKTMSKTKRGSSPFPHREKIPSTKLTITHEKKKLRNVKWVKGNGCKGWSEGWMRETMGVLLLCQAWEDILAESLFLSASHKLISHPVCFWSAINPFFDSRLYSSLYSRMYIRLLLAEEEPLFLLLQTSSLLSFFSLFPILFFLQNSLRFVCDSGRRRCRRLNRLPFPWALYDYSFCETSHATKLMESHKRRHTEEKKVSKSHVSQKEDHMQEKEDSEWKKRGTTKRHKTQVMWKQGSL